MLTYLWKVHKPSIIAYLVAFITLVLCSLTLLLLGMANIYSWEPITSPLLLLNFISFYFIYFNSLLLLITIYTFSGKRFKQMLIVLGKGKTFILQYSIFFLMLLIAPLGPYLYSIYSTNIALYVSGITVPWFFAITSLVIYHLLFFSNLKYKDFLLQGAIYVAIGIFSFIVYTIFQTSYTVMNNQVFSIQSIEESLAPIGQLTMSYHNFSNFIFIQLLLITFLMLVFGVLEVMKVGRSWKN